MKSLSSLLGFLIFSSFLGNAEAATIPSMKDCTMDLYQSNPMERSYIVADSRIAGPKASNLVQNLRNNKASVNTQVDLLNVPRYDVVTKRILLDKRGADPKSCEGVLSAMKVVVCTEDASVAVCELRCEFKWDGADCR